jgi:antitoxin CptB
MSELSRIRFRCRRGMKELDVLLEAFLSRHYTDADLALQQSFLAVLDVEDPDLWAWIIGHAPPPAQFADVIARLQRND